MLNGHQWDVIFGLAIFFLGYVIGRKELRVTRASIRRHVEAEFKRQSEAAR